MEERKHGLNRKILLLGKKDGRTKFFFLMMEKPKYRSFQQNSVYQKSNKTFKNRQMEQPNLFSVDILTKDGAEAEETKMTSI